MVKIIMGPKGSGKTKRFIADVNDAVKNEAGSMVCIENGKNLTYDVDYRVRLINAQEYEIKDVTLLKGFISGLHAGNFDITHVFIEGLYKIIGADLVQAEAFVAWCETFGKQNDMSFTVTISDDPARASEDLKKYL